MSGRHEDSSKKLSHFLRAWADSRKKFNVLQEYGAGETPQALAPRRLTATPVESEVPRDRQGTPVTGLIILEAFLSGAEYNTTKIGGKNNGTTNRKNYQRRKLFNRRYFL
jgi:hypothetical protein